MHILFIADPLASFKIYKDTTFAMMREAAKRGHTINACEVSNIRWAQASGVVADTQIITLTGQADRAWYVASPLQATPLKAFDAVIMRKDPPFDSEYFYATHLLEQAEREGAKVLNSPRALRDHPEKLALMEFAHLAAPTLVTRDIARIKAFHAEHQDVILKPLDGMGGVGIFRVRDDALNLGAIAETLTADGTQTIMAQRYLPAIKDGDKRVLLIGGKPVPYALARIPQGGEVRGNLAAGGKGVAQKLSDSDLKIATELGETLAGRGLLLVGLDVIGDKLTEINVTSPTCFQEIFDQTGCDVAAMFVAAVEAATESSRG
ncbi:MAG: glutathione synthase [Cytophagales bacterium]|nr:glutathione synthase [Cytophagales bacterium]